MSAPAPASARAMPRPMPEVDPVTIAALPLSVIAPFSRLFLLRSEAASTAGVKAASVRKSLETPRAAAACTETAHDARERGCGSCRRLRLRPRLAVRRTFVGAAQRRRPGQLFAATAVLRAARRHHDMCMASSGCTVARPRSDQRPRGQMGAEREQAEEEASPEHLLADPTPHPAAH